MNGHLKNILMVLVFFSLVAVSFYGFSAGSYWFKKEDLQMQEAKMREDILRQQQTELSEKNKVLLLEYQERTKAANEATEKINAATAKIKAETDVILAKREADRKLILIVQNLEKNRKICTKSHEETWWFVCLANDDEGKQIPDTDHPCEVKTIVCENWAVKRGLEKPGEKYWPH